MSHTRQKSAPRNSKSDDLHGNAPDRSSVALLLVDVINDLDFPQNDQLLRESAQLAKRIAKMKQRCKQAGIPTIYVNDNHGKWRSQFPDVLKHCLRHDSPGRAMVKELVPQADDYIVLKPKHSPFYATPLQLLLEYIGVKTVILAGITTNACVMIAASDVYIRDYRLFVPSDCVAALTVRDQRNALKLMKQNFEATTTPSGRLDLSKLLAPSLESSTHPAR